MQETDELISTEQTALMLGSSTGTVYRLIRQGTLEAVQQPVSIPVWRYVTKVKKSSVEAFLRSREGGFVIEV